MYVKKRRSLKRNIQRMVGGVVAVCMMTALFLSPGFGMETQAAKAGVVSSEACQLINRQTIEYFAHLSSIPSGDDNMLYLYQLKTYEYAIADGAVPVASCEKTADPVIHFPLDSTASNGRLYAKFALAVLQNGKPVMIGNPQYISNPEMMATKSHRVERPAKSTQGIETTNIIINGSGTGDVPVTHVNRSAQILVGAGSVVTHPSAANEVNDPHPWEHTYYMMNAADDAGIEGLVKDLQNYAANSRAQDFIIGNEVNERKWNYMTWTDWDSFVREYTQAFRVCYTAIKSVNAQANVYVSLDQCWDRNRPKSHPEYYSYIDVKDFLIKFNQNISSSGNIDWCLAIHPYTVPLTYAKFWDMSGVTVETPEYCRSQVANNNMVTFQNVSVITNFMCQPAYLNRSGQVRDIIVNEFGVSATQGEDVQVAALCAAFYSFESNPYITQVIYLNNLGDGVDSRLSERGWAAFESFGTPEEAAYMDWAKQYIGISDWSKVIR